MRALVLAALLTGCAMGADPERALTNAPLARALVGTWCNSDDGGRSCWAHDVFTADGAFRACGRLADDPEPFEGAGDYRVDGDLMCYRVARATPNFWVRPGSSYCTRILSISAASHTYQDVDSGRTDRLLRVTDARERCPAIGR